jgi:hypothetical protein
MLDVLFLMLIAAALIWPLFQVEYFDNWMSIDGAFIADARFLNGHLPAPGWVPSFYCGNRMDYLYPPAIRYGTVLVARLLAFSVARAYHFYSAIMYCMAAAGVYVLVRAAGKSRTSGWCAALASLILSPALAIFKEIRMDSAQHMPERLNIIVKWGEVAHTSSFAVLPFALAASWSALRSGRPRLIAAAALLCALTVSFNFYGATALGILFSLMVWTLWAVDGCAHIWRRAGAITALAYALTAWWLTPSFVKLTARNLMLVAESATPGSQAITLALLAVFAVAARFFGRGHPERAWPVFVAGGVSLFGLATVGAYYFHFHAIGNSARLIPEFDLLLIIAAVTCLGARQRVVAVTAGLALAGLLALAVPYLLHPWKVYVLDLHPERRIEYRLTDWLARNLPGSRVHMAGSLGFWSGMWRDVPQIGGVSDQGMENLNIALANWQIITGDRATRDVYWLQALGAGAIVIHGPQSQEYYHAIRDSGKFNGRLRVLYDSGQDDVVYAVPRRFPELARVVDSHRMQSLPAIPWNDQNEPQLQAYVETLEQGPDIHPLVQWTGPASLEVQARVGQGQSLVVQETYDPAWHAWVAGREVPVSKDPLGFMRIDVPAGTQHLVLRFDTPLEVRLGRWFSGLALAMLLPLGIARRRW